MSSLLNPGEISIDWTMLSTFLSCEKKFYWRFVRDLVPNRTALPLMLGAAIHKGLETYYTSDHDAVKAMCAICTEGKALGLPETIEEAKEEDDSKGRSIQLGCWIMSDYADYYGKDVFEVIETEIGIVIVLIPNKLTYVGRVDAIARMLGRVYVLEHKTTSSLGYNFFDKFKLSYQASGYILGVKTTSSYDVAGAIINGLATSGVITPAANVKNMSKEEALGKRFGRAITNRSDQELNRDLQCIKDSAQRILRRVEHGDYLMNPNACTMYRLCEYHQLCTTMDHDMMDSMIGGSYKVDPWYPTDGLAMLGGET